MRTLRISHKSSKVLKFRFKDQDGKAIVISDADEITFGIKDGLIAGIEPLLEKTLTGNDLTLVGETLTLTFADLEWADLPVGEYVADFLIQKPANVNIRSRVFALVIDPVVVEV